MCRDQKDHPVLQCVHKAWKPRLVNNCRCRDGRMAHSALGGGQGGNSKDLLHFGRFFGAIFWRFFGMALQYKSATTLSDKAVKSVKG